MSRGEARTERVSRAPVGRLTGGERHPLSGVTVPSDRRPIEERIDRENPVASAAGFLVSALHAGSNSRHSRDMGAPPYIRSPLHDRHSGRVSRRTYNPLPELRRGSPDRRDAGSLIQATRTSPASDTKPTSSTPRPR